VYGFAKSWEIWDLLPVFIGAMILAVVSIYGDLFASVVKRHFGVKDYGKLFPGHGGIMDRFDSTIPVAITLQVLLLIPYFEKLL
jgi:phosphatidate cytidylyltransferase